MSEQVSTEKKWHRVLAVFGPFIVLAFVLLLFASLLAWRNTQEPTDPPYADLRNFFSLPTLKIVLTQTVIVAIGALGMTMIIVSGGIDLSVGSAVALSSVMGARVLEQGGGVPMAIGATILAGILVGVVNGTLVGPCRMTPFIVTLGMLGAARGAAKWQADNQTVNFPESDIGKIMADPDIFGAMPPIGVWITAGLAILTAILMKKTVFGRYIFAIGSNESTARLCGIRTRLVKFWIYTIAGFFVGMAGIMQLSRLRQGDPTAAIGAELDIIAAVVIGGASLNGGTGSILGSMIGALTMAILRTGSQYMDWPTYMQEIIIGALIIIAVALDKLRQSRAS